MLSAKLCFNFDSEKEAYIVASSLSPEMKHNIPKTSVDLQLHKTTITLAIYADELSSLRAACNSYLRWINTALTVQSVI